MASILASEKSHEMSDVSRCVSGVVLDRIYDRIGDAASAVLADDGKASDPCGRLMGLEGR
jgi:hypothetical protein